MFVVNFYIHYRPASSKQIIIVQAGVDPLAPARLPRLLALEIPPHRRPTMGANLLVGQWTRGHI